MLAAKSFNATSSPAELDRWMGILAEELAHRLTEDGATHSRAPRGLTLSYRCHSHPLLLSQLHVKLLARGLTLSCRCHSHPLLSSQLHVKLLTQGLTLSYRCHFHPLFLSQLHVKLLALSQKSSCQQDVPSCISGVPMSG